MVHYVTELAPLIDLSKDTVNESMTFRGERTFNRLWKDAGVAGGTSKPTLKH